MLQCDATYKLVWQGYPVLLAGTTDRSRVFHPFALAITKSKSTEDFQFLFAAIHNAHLDWAPCILLADGSEAITNAFIAVFGEPLVRLMCYFHVKENIEKFLKPLMKEGVVAELNEDIYT